MRKINRASLSPAALKELQRVSVLVGKASDPGAKAVEEWPKLKRWVREEIFDALKKMARGYTRCMYCEDSQGTDIEHFRPKRQYPNYAYDWKNYLLACSACNSNYKRTKFPVDASKNPLLIDPTAENPMRYLSLSPTTGSFVASEPKGLNSIDVFGLNRQNCETGRRDMWTTLSVIIPEYARLKQKGDDDRAEKILIAVRRYPFQTVRAHMVQIYELRKQSELLLPSEVVQCFESYPEIMADDDFS